ncbi:MAG: ribonuclease HII [Candidatus Eutrophobiaceae bacterium]
MSFAHLHLHTEYSMVDSPELPSLACPIEAVIKGDSRYSEIAAASILAKVTRDAEMRRLEQQYPHYGFSRHKGYSVAEHLRALESCGVSPVHRKSFAPVKRLLP